MPSLTGVYAAQYRYDYAVLLGRLSRNCALVVAPHFEV